MSDRAKTAQELRRLADVAERIGSTQLNMPVPLRKDEHFDLKNAALGIRQLLDQIAAAEKQVERWKKLGESIQCEDRQLQKMAVDLGLEPIPDRQGYTGGFTALEVVDRLGKKLAAAEQEIATASKFVRGVIEAIGFAQPEPEATIRLEDVRLAVVGRIEESKLREAQLEAQLREAEQTIATLKGDVLRDRAVFIQAELIAKTEEELREQADARLAAVRAFAARTGQIQHLSPGALTVHPDHIFCPTCKAELLALCAKEG